MLKRLIAPIKPYLRWFILGLILYFLLKTLQTHWQEVSQIKLDNKAWWWLFMALMATFFAHCWSAFVWVKIFSEFQHPILALWGLRLYLKTNLAKYLPGNVWHFYGRIKAVQEFGVSASIAVLSVLIEPILMALASLILGFICLQFTNFDVRIKLVILGLILAILALLHPRFFNSIIAAAGRLKQKTLGQENQNVKIILVQRYPISLLLGELGFISLRSLGFLLVLVAIFPALEITKIPIVISAFCLAWVLGLVVPGAPGGIGIFEATAVVLLNNILGAATILSTVAFYRLISVIAETLAGLGAVINRAK